MVDVNLRRQYQQIANDIETQGLGYALAHYIEPNTGDSDLNEAITKIHEGMAVFERIIEPYRT